MKAKKLIFNILASVGMVLLILPMCLAMYTSKTTNSAISKDLTNDTFGIFADWSAFADTYKLGGKTFASAWSVITDVIAIVLLVLAVAYVVLFVAQLLKVGKKFNYEKVLKVISIAILVLTLVALVTAIIFTSANNLTLTVGRNETKYTFGFGVGLIMLLVGGVVTGVMGLLANLKK